jgi:hypothetical protein
VPEDLEHVSLVDVLARRQVGPLTPPMAQTTHLPLHDLDPGMFERVVVELAWRVETPVTCSFMAEADRLSMG